MNETAPSDETSSHPAPGSPDASVHPAGHRPTRRRRASRGGWLDYVVTMVVALVIAVLVKTFLIQPFFIPSESMLPTLEIDDKIIVSKLTPGVFDLQRGDVIVFEDPDHWVAENTTRQGARYQVLKTLSYVGLAPDPAQDHLVKRLIGLPGDHVVCAEQGGDLAVNGVTLAEPYVNEGNTPCQAQFDITVPAGNVWVMGDNREASADSANHYARGDASPYVPESRITGKAEVIMWPASRWAALDDGEKVFADVPDPS